MTREEILGMEPGEELDALVAEKVVGECCHEWVKAGPNVWDWGCSKCNERYSSFGEKRPPIVGEDTPYSTDIAAAWEVAERLSKNIGCYFMWQHVDYATVDCGAKCNGRTMPEAICKAALLATLTEQG